MPAYPNPHNTYGTTSLIMTQESRESGSHALTRVATQCWQRRCRALSVGGHIMEQHQRKKQETVRRREMSAAVGLRAAGPCIIPHPMHAFHLFSLFHLSQSSSDPLFLLVLQQGRTSCLARPGLNPEKNFSVAQNHAYPLHNVRFCMLLSPPPPLLPSSARLVYTEYGVPYAGSRPQPRPSVQPRPLWCAEATP